MAGLKCPLCGRPLPPGWQERQYQAMPFGALTPMPAGTEYERREPARAPTVQGDVAVPALQAVISGVITGVAGTAIAVILEWSKPVAVGLVATGVTWSGAWFLLLRDNRRLLWKIEVITGMDVDRDGAVGEPPERPVTTVEIVERRGHVRRYVDVPLDDGELENIANAVLIEGMPFSRRKLAEAGALVEERYGSVMEPMLEGGLLRPRGKGVEVTPAGRAFLRQFLPPTPLQQKWFGRGGDHHPPPPTTTEWER